MRILGACGLMLVALSAVAAPTPEQRAYVRFLAEGGEKQVKDATWMGSDSLYIGMIDDGSRHDGYAEYICMASADHNVYPAMVKVVDIAKVVKDQKFEEIGKAYCNEKPKES